MSLATLKALNQALPGVRCKQTYGLTEVGILPTRSEDAGSTWMKVGGEHHQTRIVDGILWIRSEYRMLGYLNAPSGFDDQGWFNTQDRVEVDGEYFRILGRITDLINVGGQKVYPAEVEDVILGQPNVDDVVVVGEKHALLGQIVVARVLLRQTEPLPALRLRLRQACLARLASFKVPVRVELLDQQIYSARFKKMRR